MTGTPAVSKYSIVKARSKIAFGPALTTATFVRPNSGRSAEISKLCCAPRCTPPMPPVAKTAMPANSAAIMVAATVVAPVCPLAMTEAISRRLTFVTGTSPEAKRCNSRSDRPMVRRPSMMAMVAGTAPSARMMASKLRAVSLFSG